MSGKSKSKKAPAKKTTAKAVELPTGEETTVEPITGPEAGIVVDEHGVEHVGILPESATVPPEVAADAGEIQEAVAEGGEAPNGEPITPDTTSNAEPQPEPVVDEHGNAKTEEAPEATPAEPKGKKTPLTDEEKKARAAARKAEKANLKKLAADPEEVVEALAPVTYEKDFVILERDHYGANMDHAKEFAFVVREALAHGWRATAQPTFLGDEKHPDGKSVILHYSVEVVAAS